ncbi:MAG: response regulator transcription factor [Lachnospiraceae bacterium]|jgi:two-component system response regulator RegX3|nr:response regulator transcription factor [Lachnospiraceae bacterium]
MRSTILLLEDDLSLIDGLVYMLEREGYRVQVARTIKEAREALKGEIPYALLILDITLPDGTGFMVCEEVRRSGSQVPILFLTASDEELQIIRGLDSGGDDYLTKPFRFGELCSRIRALLRRSSYTTTNQEASVLRSGPLEIHLTENRVLKKQQPLLLTAMEYRLLCLLVQNRGKILTREILLNRLWDQSGNFVDDNTLSVHIRRLREKIEEQPSHPQYLVTVRGFGYQWKEGE